MYVGPDFNLLNLSFNFLGQRLHKINCLPNLQCSVKVFLVTHYLC